MKSGDFWDDVLFSDEFKFNLKNSDGQHFICKKRGGRLLEKKCHKNSKIWW